MNRYIEFTHRKTGNPVLVHIESIVTVRAIFAANKRGEAQGTSLEFFGSTLEVSEPYEDVKGMLFNGFSTAEPTPVQK
jgi:hypothetical protein